MATDDHAGFGGFDHYLAGIGVEIDVAHAGVVGHRVENVLTCTLWVRQDVGVRPDGDPFAEFAGELPYQVTVTRELLWVSRIEDELGTFVPDVRNRDVRREFARDLCFDRFELLFYRAHSSEE